MPGHLRGRLPTNTFCIRRSVMENHGKPALDSLAPSDGDFGGQKGIDRDCPPVGDEPRPCRRFLSRDHRNPAPSSSANRPGVVDPRGRRAVDLADTLKTIGCDDSPAVFYLHRLSHPYAEIGMTGRTDCNVPIVGFEARPDSHPENRIGRIDDRGTRLGNQVFPQRSSPFRRSDPTEPLGNPEGFGDLSRRRGTLSLRSDRGARP